MIFRWKSSPKCIQNHGEISGFWGKMIACLQQKHKELGQKMKFSNLVNTVWNYVFVKALYNTGFNLIKFQIEVVIFHSNKTNTYYIIF